MKKIPTSEFTFNFSRSSGAGGQNVNKLNTKATLTWNIKESPSCIEPVKNRFIKKYKRFIIGENVILKSQRFRSQARNIEDCIHKLHEYLKEVEYPPKSRRPTRPTKSSVLKRLKNKKSHSDKKKSRREKY